MSIRVLVIFQALPGHADELLRLLQKDRDVSRCSPGCESFELFQREDDRQKFMLIERWTSIDAHHKNMTEHIIDEGHFGGVLALLAGPPDNGVIELID